MVNYPHEDVNKRETAANEIMSFIERLTKTAERVTGKAAEKLAPVCAQPCPTTSLGERAEREYPPLFSDMRGMLITIETSLDRLDDVIGRVEV